MTSVLYAPKIVCKICGTEENVTAVMSETYTTPSSVIQAFTCTCSECMTSFRYEVNKISVSKIVHHISSQ